MYFYIYIAAAKMLYTLYPKRNRLGIFSSRKQAKPSVFGYIKKYMFMEWKYGSSECAIKFCAVPQTF